MIDSYNRNIDYLRISITDLCNLRCSYCMPKGVTEKLRHKDIITYEEVENLCRAAASLGVKKVRITGGEPLVRPDISKLISKIKAISGIEDISITTNGVLLLELAQELRNSGLDRLNISLDSLKKHRYSALTGKDELEKVLKGIEKAKEVGFEKIKINVVLLKGINSDEIRSFVEMAKDYCEVRFIELMPIGENLSYYKKYYLSSEEVLKVVPELEVKEVQSLSSPAVYYTMGGKYDVGLIRPMTCSFCSNCNRIRVTSDKKLKLCLHSQEEIDLGDILMSEDKIREALKKWIINKPKEHRLSDKNYISRGMSRIGG